LAQSSTSFGLGKLKDKLKDKIKDKVAATIADVADTGKEAIAGNIETI
jgi:hypothetical protein